MSSASVLPVEIRRYSSASGDSSMPSATTLMPAPPVGGSAAVSSPCAEGVDQALLGEWLHEKGVGPRLTRAPSSGETVEDENLDMAVAASLLSARQDGDLRPMSAAVPPLHRRGKSIG